MTKTMTKTEMETIIKKVIKGIKLGVMATIAENGDPWCRYVSTTQIDDSLDLYCAVCMMSRKIKQIEANPRIHLTTGITPENMMGPWIQFVGRAEISTDPALKSAVWEREGEILKMIFKGPDDATMGIARFIPEKIEICGLPEDPMASVTWEV